MTYTTAAEVKAYLGIEGFGDDTLITNLIARAQSAIDAYTRRTFEASSNTIHYFAVGSDTDDQYLYLDEDLAAIDEVITDADGAATTLTLNTDFVTIPRNQTPYHTLKILSSSDYTWDYTDDPEMGVTVSGKWAYSETAPADIVQACIRLAAYYYRQKDAQVFDVNTIPDAGVITTPQGLPQDVRIMLAPYINIL